MAPSAAVRTMSPSSVGRISSRIGAGACARRRRGAWRCRRCRAPGTSTRKRPGSETSWVRRAPLCADRVLRDLAEDRLPGLEQVLDPGRCPGLAARSPSSRSVCDVAPVQDGVLGRADVDERRLHARQHVLHPAEVDVAVDLGASSSGAGDVVLDERAALEDGDLGRCRRCGRTSGSARPDGPCAPGRGDGPGWRGPPRRLRPAPPPADVRPASPVVRRGSVAGRRRGPVGSARAGRRDRRRPRPLAWGRRDRPPRPRPPRRRRRGFAGPSGTTPFGAAAATRTGGAGRVSPIFGLGGASDLRVTAGASSAAPDGRGTGGARRLSDAGDAGGRVGHEKGPF